MERPETTGDASQTPARETSHCPAPENRSPQYPEHVAIAPRIRMICEPQPQRQRALCRSAMRSSTSGDTTSSVTPSPSGRKTRYTTLIEPTSSRCNAERVTSTVARSIGAESRGKSRPDTCQPNKPDERTHASANAHWPSSTRSSPTSQTTASTSCSTEPCSLFASPRPMKRCTNLVVRPSVRRRRAQRA